MSVYEQDITQTETESGFYKIIVGYVPESTWDGLKVGMDLGREGTNRILLYDEVWFVATDVPIDVLGDVSGDAIGGLLDLAREGVIDEAPYTMFFSKCPVRVYLYHNM
jgi:hypothetical protein